MGNRSAKTARPRSADHSPNRSMGYDETKKLHCTRSEILPRSTKLSAPSARHKTSTCSIASPQQRRSCFSFLLTPAQTFQLRDSWRKMSKTGTHSFGATVVRVAFQKCPDIRHAFQRIAVIESACEYGLAPTPTCHEHSKLVVDLVDTIINSLEEGASEHELNSKLAQVGSFHAQYSVYGLEPKHWDVFGEAIMDAVAQQRQGGVKAWATVASYIADQLRASYESQVRVNKLGPRGSADSNSLSISSLPEGTDQYRCKKRRSNRRRRGPNRASLNLKKENPDHDHKLSMVSHHSSARY